MIAIIFGNQKPRNVTRLNKVLKDFLGEIGTFNTVKFDARENLIQDVILEASYLPLGCDKKAIVIDNAYFLSKGKITEKIEKDQNYSKLTSYLENSNEETLLVFMLNSVDIDKKSAIFKIAEKEGKIYELLDISKDDWPVYVREYFKKTLNTRIDNDAVFELVTRVNGDLSLFQNEAEKLSLYTEHVTIEDVNKLVTKPLSENAYLIFNYLLKGDNKKAVEVYRDLRVQNIEAINLISMLANQFRTLNMLRFLLKEGYDYKEAAAELKMNEYRAKILASSLRNVNGSVIKDALENLSILDRDIKSGLIDRFYGLELFLLRFKK